MWPGEESIFKAAAPDRLFHKPDHGVGQALQDSKGPDPSDGPGNAKPESERFLRHGQTTTVEALCRDCRKVSKRSREGHSGAFGQMNLMSTT